MSENSIDRVYRERSERFARVRDRCAARSRRLTHARLATFIAAALPILLFFEPGAPFNLLWLAVTGFFAALFLALVLYQNELNRRCCWHDELVRLNEEGRARRARNWDALPKRDPAELGSVPPAAEDLDLFGHASLFDLVGTVATPPGRATLRRWLLEPDRPDVVLKRQAAVAELAPLIDLRQQITVRGRSMPNATAEALDRFVAWAEDEPWLLTNRRLVWTARLLPLLTLLLIALNVAGLVSHLTWLTMLAVNLAFSFTAGARIHGTFDRAFARESSFQGYAGILRLLSLKSFTAPSLQREQVRLTASGLSAYRQMERLHRLVSQSEVRYSMLYLPIQALTLWDFHALVRLERWQMTAGRRVRAWLETLGSLDGLAALAGLHFDNPDWAFPEIVEQDPPVLEASDLGHPLLPDEVRVGNDVELGPPGTFLLITGSNMSGKSTLLRAIGTNVVLARAGAPVCAKKLRLPPLQLETSMRVHDSLQQGLSHFMAELQRLKRIVERAGQPGASGGGTLLYLLDDIFQGTNTVERQIAARKVLKHLVETGAIGGVTSHDLHLADTQDLAAACVPVHFSEVIEERPGGPQISFDYKLQSGIATSSNALKLLEMVGLTAETSEGAGSGAR